MITLRRTAALIALGALASACASLGLHRPPSDDGPEGVEIVLDDGSMSLTPRQVAAGKIGFELENRGNLEHALRVVGPGFDEQIVQFLSPSEHRRQSLRLGPGTYRIFCPDGNHAERGLSAQLIVTETPTYFRR